MDFRDWLNDDPLFSEDTEDQVLVAAAKEGDRSALANLLARWERKIFSAILRKSKNQQDAEDITQEVIQRIIQAMEKAPPKNFQNWIWSVIRNTMANYYRRQKISTVSDPGETVLKMSPKKMGKVGFGLPSISSKDDPTTLASEHEHKELMYRALQAMLAEGGYSERRTRFLMKQYFDGMKISEIAQEEDLPIGTVKRAIHQAKKDLLRRLKKGGLEK